MWYPATVQTPPTSEPVTLQQAKEHCRISANDQSRDAELTLLIKSARASIENHCGIRLMPQTVEVECDSTSDFARFAQAPLRGIASISYVDLSGAIQAVADDVFEARADGLSPSIALKPGKVWPNRLQATRIKVTAEVGYEEVPFDIVAALLLTVGKLIAFSRNDLLLKSEEVDGVGTRSYAGAVDVTATLDGLARDLLEPYRNWAL